MKAMVLHEPGKLALVQKRIGKAQLHQQRREMACHAAHQTDAAKGQMHQRQIAGHRAEDAGKNLARGARGSR